ncbi:MAG: hypothetical protein WBB19_05695, partial [Desulforhopalus sp.]
LIVAFLGLDDTGFIALILLGISWWCLDSYSVKNSRVVEGREKWKLTGVVLAGSICVEFFLLLPPILAKQIPLNIFIITILLTIPINLLTILLAHWGVKNEIPRKRKTLSGSKR